MKQRWLLLCLLATLPRPAAAESYGGGEPSFGQNPPKNYASSQWFALEIKFGPYSPDIDSSPGLKPGSHPFADLFNPASKTHERPGGQLLSQVEFDVELFHKFGTLAIGHSIGFYRRTTHALQYNMGPGGQLVPCTLGVNCTASGDETGIDIIPLSLLAVYRFDVLYNRWHIPLVPYLKTGPAYYIWWIENGGGFASVSSVTTLNGTITNNPSQPGSHTVSGSGGTFGWVVQPGLAFALDVLEQSAARTLDSELGINHTYLFIEMNYANISGFGARDKLVLTDLTFSAGLAFEF